MAQSLQHVVFLSASSGGGHNGTARAFVAWMERSGSSAHCEIVDVYGGGLRLLPWMACIRQHSNIVWRAFTALMDWPPLLRCCRAILEPIIVRRCVRAIPRRPDLIVATHFAPAQFMREIAAHFNPPPRTLTIASDYQPHRAWFGNADLTVVSDPLGVERARACGVPFKQLFPVTLLPARPADRSQTNDARHGRNALHLCAVMGADGTSAARLIAVLDGLEHRAHGDTDLRIHIDIICGRNQRLRTRLATHALQYRNVIVETFGFVDDVPARLAAADVALIRASPLVLTEALGQGLPVLAFDWHAHEGAAVALLERWGNGYASRSPSDITARLLRWARHPEELAAARRRASRLANDRFDESTVRALLARTEGIAA